MTHKVSIYPSRNWPDIFRGACEGDRFCQWSTGWYPIDVMEKKALEHEAWDEDLIERAPVGRRFHVVNDTLVPLDGGEVIELITPRNVATLPSI
jgi:hypothetical protein